MTDRYSGYIVVMDGDMRDDDAENVINAIKMIKGVINVTPVVSGAYSQTIAEGRRDRAWQDALYKLAHSGPERDE